MMICQQSSQGVDAQRFLFEWAAKLPCKNWLTLLSNPRLLT